MGAANARLAFVRWSSLPDQPFRVLTYMALVSLDDPGKDTPARRYFGGRDSLVIALGRDLPGEPDPEDDSPDATRLRRDRKNAYEAVRLALGALRKAGAIKEIRRGRGHRNGVYALELDVLPDSQFRGESGSEFRGESGSETRGYPGARPGVSQGYRNHVGATEDPSQGQDHLGTEPHQRAAGDPLEPFGLSDDDRSGFLEWLRSQGARNPEGLIRTKTEDQLRRDVEKWRKQPRSSWDRLPDVTGMGARRAGHPGDQLPW